MTKKPKIFAKKVVFQRAVYNKKWKNTDTRRKIFYVEFSNGTIWYPRNSEIETITQSRDKCFKHNINYPNIDIRDNEA